MVLNDKLLVNALVITAKNDIKRGVKKEDILRSLSTLINKDLYLRVKEIL